MRNQRPPALQNERYGVTRGELPRNLSRCACTSAMVNPDEASHLAGMGSKHQRARPSVKQMQMPVGQHVESIGIDHHRQIRLPENAGYEFSCFRFLPHAGTEGDHCFALQQGPQNASLKIAAADFAVAAHTEGDFLKGSSHQLQAHSVQQ